MIVIVDYGLGNLFSVAKAFELFGEEVLISGERDAIEKADRLVLPGVGAFPDGMRYITKRGLDQVLREEVLTKRKPFLGICLGMQLLADLGLEYGEHRGLGWINGTVRKLDVEKRGLKVPHIGWNDITLSQDHPIFRGLRPHSDFYFLHSFEFVCDHPSDVVATTVYGGAVTAAVARDTIVAVQFHPEKSQDNGLKVLENFVSWNP